MSIEVKLKVTLKGSELWPEGTIMNDSDGPLPSDIVTEIVRNTGTVEVLSGSLDVDSMPPEDSEPKEEVPPAGEVEPEEPPEEKPKKVSKPKKTVKKKSAKKPIKKKTVAKKKVTKKKKE